MKKFRRQLIVFCNKTLVKIIIVNVYHVEPSYPRQNLRGFLFSVNITNNTICKYAINYIIIVVECNRLNFISKEVFLYSAIN